MIQLCYFLMHFLQAAFQFQKIVLIVEQIRFFLFVAAHILTECDYRTYQHSNYLHK